MHGTPFVQSGRHAVKLLTLNICNTIAINSIGDFVVVMSRILLVGIAVALTYLLVDVSTKNNNKLQQKQHQKNYDDTDNNKNRRNIQMQQKRVQQNTSNDTKNQRYKNNNKNTTN